VLFDYHLFGPIMRGEITLTFRAWKRPQARIGARHRLNSEGVIEIASVRVVPFGAITAAEARLAGFTDRASLRAALTRRGAAPDQVYRVAFRFVREPDPRAILARSPALTDAEAASLTAKLDRMDARSADGPWTRATLRLIAENPRVISTALASRVGRERLAFKLDVRKLKALGLTISHDVGYEISPRGRAFLESDRKPR
jgi:hypothetical protein